MVTKRVESFGLEEGDGLAGRYVVAAKLGSGWESEVYLVKERATGVARAAKLFFPQRNPKGRVAKAHARKLHRMQVSASVVQYVSHDEVFLEGQMVTMLVSEFVRGEPLHNYVQRQRGKRLDPFSALHLLRTMASALATLHQHGEYHGDLHEENVLVERYGLAFDIKLLDPLLVGRRTKEHLQEDLVDLVRLYVESLGGKDRYRVLPAQWRDVVGSSRKDRVLARFRSVARLRDHLDHYRWD